MFKLIGALLAIYTACAAANGTIHAKSGIRMRTIAREESPGYFWSVVGIYGVLSLLLLTYF
jgi:hypothetical protein